MERTPADRRLSEQRQRHAYYRRYVGEGTGTTDLWTPTQQGGEPIAIDDPHHDHERALRDADELLDEDHGAARSALDSYVAKAQADDLAKAFLADQHPRLAKVLRDRRPGPALLSQQAEVDLRLVDAMHAIYYADVIAETSLQVS